MSNLAVPTPGGPSSSGNLSSMPSFTTPTKRVSYNTSQTGTTATGMARASSALQASPAYASNLRKHSLYGTEDRIVIDPGSRIWKVGFSGEPSPRRVFDPSSPTPSSSSISSSARESPLDELWDIDFPSMMSNLRAEREEYTCIAPSSSSAVAGSSLESGANTGVSLPAQQEVGSGADFDRLDVLLKARLTKALRATYHKHLLTDPKSRKVIILENPFLPVKIKELIVSILFENLKVPSISFIPHGVAALLAVGKATGLVIDVGHLETIVLPVYGLRPLYNHLTTTPTAGRAYLRRLSALIHRFGTYRAPQACKKPMMPRRTRTGWSAPPTISSVAEGGAESASGSSDMLGIEEEVRRVPKELLTREVLEDIRMQACSVAKQPPSRSTGSNTTEATPTGSRQYDEPHLLSLEQAYREPSSEKPDYTFTFPAEPLHRSGSTRTVTTPAQISIPRWILQGTAEIFFEMGDEDEESIVEAILECLSKLPKDLRLSMASAMLISGGGGMLRGFIPRLRTALEASIADKPSSADTGLKSSLDESSQTAPATSVMTTHQRSVLRAQARARRTQHHRPYVVLAGLSGRIKVLNDPSVWCDTEEGGEKGATSCAPRWNAHCLGWIGGSLTGGLQVASGELTREQFDAANERLTQGGTRLDVFATPMAPTTSFVDRQPQRHFSDWSRPLVMI